MLHSRNSRLAAAIVIAVFALLIKAGPALAVQTTISATVSAVRIVTLDQNRNIIRIDSNTPDNSVTPTALIAPDNTPTTLSPDEISMYSEIISTVPSDKYGEVYQAPVVQGKSLIDAIIGLPLAVVNTVSNFLGSLT